MKKLIFLLLIAAALAGMVSAQGAAHPPWASAFEAALPGDGVDCYAADPGTDLAAALLPAVQPASIGAAPGIIAVFDGQPCLIIARHCTEAAHYKPGYWLRL